MKVLDGKSDAPLSKSSKDLGNHEIFLKPYEENSDGAKFSMTLAFLKKIGKIISNFEKFTKEIFISKYYLKP